VVIKILLILFIFLFNHTTYTQTAKEYYNNSLEKHQNGDYYCAIANYTKSIELNPNFAYAYFNKVLQKKYLRI
jgi:Tfp pilus assembly protein PilF